MAVKPTVVFAFAPQTNYTTGPFIGSAVKVDPAGAAEGYVPATVIPSEFFNFMHNASGLWSSWLLAGEIAPTLDAHIVETDASGRASVALGVFGDTAAADIPVIVEENTAINPCVQVNKANTSSAAAVEITSIARAIYADHSVGAGSATAEFESTALGLCLQLTQSNATPTRGQLNMDEVNPAVPVAGDIWKSPSVASNQRGWLSLEDSNGQIGGGAPGTLKAHASPGGIGYRYVAQGVGLTSDNTTLVTAASVTVDPGGDELRPGEGLYLINYSAQVKLDVGTTLTTRVQVQLLANSVIVNQFFIQFSNANQALPVSGIFEQDVSPGPITFEIKFAQSNGVPTEDVICENARISAQGSYDRL